MSPGSKHVFLSHVLSPSTPGYGGQSGFAAESTASLCHGDLSNSSRWQLSNHIGTHVDAPLHFVEAGAAVDGFGAAYWVFDRVCLMDVSAGQGALIEDAEWCNHIPLDTELLLLRTGHEKCRADEKYWSAGPGLGSRLALWLRQNRPRVRALGMDMISASSWLNREEGRVAHRAFLGTEGPGRPIVLIEDMALAVLAAAPRRVVVAPVRVEGADGAPVTVLAEL